MSRFGGQHHSSYHKRKFQQDNNPQVKEKVILPQNLCHECGRDRVNDPCSDCRSKDLDDYRKIREYISKNPRCNPIEVANGTQVSISKITRFIREGGLSSR